MITPGQTSSPVSPPPCPSIFGWLLCLSSSISGDLCLFLIIFWWPNCHPNNGTTTPQVLQPPCTLSPTSLSTLLSIDGWLFRVFIKFWPYGQLPSDLSNFWWVSVWHPKQGNQPPLAHTRCWTPSVGIFLAAATRVGGTTHGGRLGLILCGGLWDKFLSFWY